MLLLTCPHCGPRNETEFRCGGESHIERPLLECCDETWSDYLFFRHNPKGVTYERWYHGFGCGRWFNVARHTLSHEMMGVYEMGQAKPELSAPSAKQSRRAQKSNSR